MRSGRGGRGFESRHLDQEKTTSLEVVFSMISVPFGTGDISLI